MRLQFCEVCFLALSSVDSNYILSNEELLCLSFAVSGRAFRLFKYDVSSAQISVHVPVSRFLAG